MTRRPGHRTTRGERLLADAIAAAGGPLDPNPSNAATVYAPAPFLRLRYEAAGTFAYQPLTDTLRRLDVFQTWLLQEWITFSQSAKHSRRKVASSGFRRGSGGDRGLSEVFV